MKHMGRLARLLRHHLLRRPLWGNRLVEVKKNGVAIAQVTDDGDGKRVKSYILADHLGSISLTTDPTSAGATEG